MQLQKQKSKQRTNRDFRAPWTIVWVDTSDSKVAKQCTCGRAKTSAIIKKGLGSQVMWSIATNIHSALELMVQVRRFDIYRANIVTSHFYHTFATSGSDVSKDAALFRVVQVGCWWNMMDTICKDESRKTLIRWFQVPRLKDQNAVLGSALDEFARNRVLLTASRTRFMDGKSWPRT